jgi:hypothetical protein
LRINNKWVSRAVVDNSGILKRHSPALLTKPYGKEKVFLLIECLLRMPLLSTTALDTHLLLILNYKDSLGSRVRKAVICKSSNSVKRDGPKRSSRPYLTVRSL